MPLRTCYHMDDFACHSYLLLDWICKCISKRFSVFSIIPSKLSASDRCSCQTNLKSNIHPVTWQTGKEYSYFATCIINCPPFGTSTFFQRHRAPILQPATYTPRSTHRIAVVFDNYNDCTIMVTIPSRSHGDALKRKLDDRNSDRDDDTQPSKRSTFGIIRAAEESQLVTEESQPATLDTLATELLCLIFQQQTITFNQKKRLSLVCRRFRLILRPVLFRTLALGTDVEGSGYDWMTYLQKEGQHQSLRMFIPN